MDFTHIQTLATGGALLFLRNRFLNTQTTEDVPTKSRVHSLILGLHLSDRVPADGAPDHTLCFLIIW